MTATDRPAGGASGGGADRFDGGRDGAGVTATERPAGAGSGGGAGRRAPVGGETAA